MIVSSRSHTKTRSKSDSGPGEGSGRRPPCFFALLDSEIDEILMVSSEKKKLEDVNLNTERLTAGHSALHNPKNLWTQ